MRTLSERLADLRTERGTGVTRPPAPRGDRSELLARWFGARLQVAHDGAAVVVERRITLRAATLANLHDLPAGCYFDTETTGLSTGAGTVVFLAGLGHVEGSALVVRQLLLPDYPHEAALLRLVAAELAALPRVVTYNGRGFDLPLLISRLTVHRLFREMAALPERHDDLLPVARRLYRRPLGGARLADVESGVLGVVRSGDCPGSEVPSRYFGYLRGGSPDLLTDVLDHNLQDIVSLALLEAEIVRMRAGGWREAGVLDPHGMAVELLRYGATDEALAVVEAAMLPESDQEQAHSLRRMATRLLLSAGEVDRAEQLWTAATRRASTDAAAAWLEVARIRERHRGDLRGALEAASTASRVLDLAFALGRGGSMLAVGRVRLRVEARLRRLRRWVAAAERRRLRGVAAVA
ncbi:MAG: ribonuclease H-like domain-containing protein [Chloroflexota bacterium]|nr:ribonuclease H-like domain-containing protein [Chloroflexota bacterium]